MKKKILFLGILLTSLFVLEGGILNRSQTLEQEENLENTELAIYVEGEKQPDLPEKNNSENYVFDKAICYVNGHEDESITISWDKDAWAPIIKGLSTYKTRCDLYFKEETELDRCYEQYGKDSINCKIIAQVDDTGACPTVTEEGNVLVTSAESTNGYVCSAPDDYGTSYYFMGTVENNWVKFADSYWRIIRINGDGSIRMIYAGDANVIDGLSNKADVLKNGYNDGSTDYTQIGTSPFNSSYDDNAYVGYMYGIRDSSTYEETHRNINSSTIKTAVDTWYESHIKDTEYEQYLADALFCNDRSLYYTTPSGYSNLGYGTEVTAYRWYDYSSSRGVTLNCAQQNDRFTVEDSSIGNGDLTYPIGLLTTDEAYLAGGYSNVSNSKYYLYTGNIYWTLSPFNFRNGNAYVRRVYSSGNANSLDNVRNSYGVRPVLNLKSGSLKSGLGTANDPYQV